jgi:hypothetical protein
MMEPEGMDPRKAQLLAMLEEAGVWVLKDLARMAFGGPVQYKANWFWNSNVLDPNLKQMEEIKAMIAQLSGRPPEAGLVQIQVLILKQ